MTCSILTDTSSHLQFHFSQIILHNRTLEKSGGKSGHMISMFSLGHQFQVQMSQNGLWSPSCPASAPSTALHPFTAISWALLTPLTPNDAIIYSQPTGQVIEDVILNTLAYKVGIMTVSSSQNSCAHEMSVCVCVYIYDWYSN